MRILAVIPARGGSKGIPSKNIAPLNGRPLIAYTIDAAQAAAGIDRVVVSTDDEEIAKVSRAEGAEVLMRPAALADDYAATRPVLTHVVELLAGQNYHPDAVMTLQPTSPLRSASHIDEAVALFVSDPSADSLVSCISLPHIYHPHSVMRINADGYLEPFIDAPQPGRRQEKEPVFARNGAAIYITRTHQLSKFVFGGRLLAYMMNELHSIDIDTPEDLLKAEMMLSG